MSSTVHFWSKDGSIDLSKYPEIIDMAIFEQILEMDDDPNDREFSSEIVFGFFSQAESTMDDMKKKLDDGELNELSNLGHFLKGSSATLGLVKLQKSYELIQNYGRGMDATGNEEEKDERKSLQNIRNALRDAQQEYVEARYILRMYFGADEE